VDVLDPNDLLAAVTEPPETFDLGGVGLEQPSRSRSHSYDPVLGAVTTTEPGEDRQRRGMRARHLHSQSTLDLIPWRSGFDHGECGIHADF